MKILIADDESLIRMGLKSLLQELGHTVISARDGSEALALARENSPDLAILDINMPKTKGLQAARAHSRYRPIPNLFLTAHAGDELITKATDLPVHGYLIKPVRSAELHAAILIATKRFHEQQQTVAREQQLETQLENRKLLDRAKSCLMQAGYSEPEAHRHIQSLARDSRRSTAEVAAEILENQAP
jgi:response regulator NasT